jgi:DNA-binding response OmpR family regulator
MPATVARPAAKVLIVDDERHIARFLEFLLNNEGYRTCVAYDGDAALECIRNFHPNAVLLDVQLPKLSGIEVLRTVRESLDSADQPVVILLTAKSLEDVMEDIPDIRADAYCSKPIAPSNLLRKLHEHAIFGSASRQACAAG